MPIYEFECNQCGLHLEQMLKVTEKMPSKCPKCKGKLSKIISQTSFTLKGSGWYKDGYSKTKPPVKETKTEGTAKTESKSKP